MKLFKNEQSYIDAAIKDEKVYQAFVKRWVSEENKPIGFEDLEYAFTDYDGKKYYSFQSLTIPPTREGKKNEYIMWLSAGVTSKQMDELLDLASNAIEDGILKIKEKKRFNVIRLAAIIEELKQRKNMNNAEVIYNILAVTLVREDENPSKFDESIQEQKVLQFMKDAEGENRFFFCDARIKQVFRESEHIKRELGRYFSRIQSSGSATPSRFNDSFIKEQVRAHRRQTRERNMALASPELSYQELIQLPMSEYMARVDLHTKRIAQANRK